MPGRGMPAFFVHNWKLALTVALLAAIFGSIVIRAPRQPIERRELQRLVMAAMILYAVGALATIAHHEMVAGVVYATGIVVCALAVWLSRGVDTDDGGDWPGGWGGPPENEQPPPGPDGLPTIDWDEFERDLATWSHERERVTEG